MQCKNVRINENKNTSRKTESDLKLFNDWLLKAREKKCNCYSVIPCPDLDKYMYLAMFVLSVRLPNGEEYEPDSLVSKFQIS